MAKISEDVSQTCFPIDEPRWETFCKSSFSSVIEEQLSFEYQRRGLEDVKVVNAKAVAKESFNVYLVCRAASP